MSVSRFFPTILPVALLAAGLHAPASAQDKCAPDNAGLTVPAGFCVTVFADKLGQARHLAVSDDGTVYVNTWRSPYKKDAKVPTGGYLVALRDADGDGAAEKVERFGEDSGNVQAMGGTGLAIHKGQLYAEATGKIVRYPLAKGTLVPAGPPAVILEGLTLEGGHNMHPFAIAADGTLFVNLGSASNACQVKDREKGSPGKDPCPELEERAGLWKYDASKMGQKFSPAGRFAKGLRNTVGLAVHPSAGLVALIHGRDQLHENWPEKFTVEQGSELPAEVMARVTAGQDYGWPYCYYDGAQDKYVLAPEYGGDGKKTDRCTDKAKPTAVHPAHWAPNALLFYTGRAFPERYRNGAFIAFHGSWNRQKQDGYNVAFVPMDAAGTPGKHEVFADGFAGPKKDPQGALHRPTGLAMGPDGALYISDDQGGRVYRVTRRP
jgi:glucose/arabinose dehydrogenase